MRVYIESNFSLEMARQQEETDAATAILELAEQRRIDLCIPAFSLSEPFSTLTYYGTDRTRFIDMLQRQTRELSRSSPHQRIASILAPLAPEIARIESDEIDQLEAITSRLLLATTMIPLTASIFHQARSLAIDFSLRTIDAVVLATVLADASAYPADADKVFISRNSKDLDDPRIEEQLVSYGCRYIARFMDGLSFIRAHMRHPST